jgi:hypothetical protein
LDLAGPVEVGQDDGFTGLDPVGVGIGFGVEKAARMAHPPARLFLGDDAELVFGPGP